MIFNLPHRGGLTVLPASGDVPIPYNIPMMEHVLPGEASIRARIEALLAF